MRIQLIVMAVAAAFLLSLVAPPAQGEIIRLKDGSFLQGKVLDSDKNFFTFLRWDTGGVVRFSWMQIIESDRLRIGRRLGLIAVEDNRSIKVDGVRFYLETGDVLEGVLVKELGTETEYCILTSPGKPFKYPKKLIKSQEPLKIEILRVYTEQQAYDMHLAVVGEPGTFGATMALADYCQRIGFYEKEKEHLEAANGLGAPDESQQQLIDNRLGVLVELIKEREVLMRIKAINRLVANKKFSEAEAEWQAVQEEFTQSKIVSEDREKVAERILREKEAFLSATVVRGWFANMRKFIQAKSRDKELTLSDAKKWAQRELSKEILLKISTDTSIAEEEIKENFDNRKTYVYRKSNYGTGTFIVDKGSSGGSSGGSSIVDQLGEKMGLGKEAREKVKEAFGFTQKKKKSSKKMLTDEEWWTKATGTARTQWLTAYYAEFSGDVEVVRFDNSDCPECGGRGYSKYLAAGSAKEGTKHKVCSRCHGLGKYRIVVYK